MRTRLSTKLSLGVIVAFVALVAAATSVVAVDTDSTVATRRLEVAACAGVTIPTAPAGSSISLISKGEPEATVLAASGSPGLARAGAALSRALGESDNARTVIDALKEVVKVCKTLGFHTQPGS
jgi:hypothetical protein